MQIPEFCDECGGVVDQGLKECKNCGKRFAANKNKVVAIVAIVALAITTFFVGAFHSTEQREPATDTTLWSGNTEPANGGIILFPDEHPSAWLDVKTDYGERMYFVLCSRASGKTVTSFYIHAGNEISVRVPAGEYDIYYASGEKWIGEAELFGKDTRYFSICGEIALGYYQTHNLDLRSSSSLCPEIEEVTVDRFPNTSN